jgi:hypothetical protein
MSLDIFLAWLVSLVPKFEALVLVVLLDTILGVAVAVKEGLFDWSKIGGFLKTYGLMAVGWLCAEALALIPSEFIPIGGNLLQQISGQVAFAALFLSALGSIAGHLIALGVVPGSVKELLSRLGVRGTNSYLNVDAAMLEPRSEARDERQ